MFLAKCMGYLIFQMENNQEFRLELTKEKGICHPKVKITQELCNTQKTIENA